jgi:hypothetical protein
VDSFLEVFHSRTFIFFSSYSPLKTGHSLSGFGLKRESIITLLGSLKEQSLVGRAKAYPHLKILRIAPGNWRMVGVA